MDPITPYLKQVRSYLRGSQQDDIVRELEENLRSQFEDREAELGRSLNDDEQEALLRQFGTPFEVAGRYSTGRQTLAFGRQLIGPVLFPFYARVLKINLGLTAIAVLVIAVALHVAVSEIVHSLLLQAAIQGGIITLIFVAAERHLSARPLSRAATPPKGDSPRFEAFAQIVASAIFTLWLLALRDSSFLWGSTGNSLHLAPVWREIYWPTVILTAASTIPALITLIRPHWTRLRGVARLVLNGAGVVLMGYLLSAGKWVLADPAGNQQAADWVNHYLFYNLLAVVIYAVGHWIWVCVKELRRRTATQQA
jgi:hypothetical protein